MPKQISAVKAIPKTEVLWEKITMTDSNVYFITSKQDRSAYYLYRQIKDGYEKIAKEKTPVNFQSLIDQQTARKCKSISK